jgi:hypothetical protein
MQPNLSSTPSTWTLPDTEQSDRTGTGKSNKRQVSKKYGWMTFGWAHIMSI